MEERKKENFKVEIICSTDEHEKVELPEIAQEPHEVKTIKPIEIIDPTIASYSNTISRQYIGESFIEFERKIALAIQKQYKKNGIVIQNFLECNHSCLLNFPLKLLGIDLNMLTYAIQKIRRRDVSVIKKEKENKL